MWVLISTIIRITIRSEDHSDLICRTRWWRGYGERRRLKPKSCVVVWLLTPSRGAAPSPLFSLLGGPMMGVWSVTTAKTLLQRHRGIVVIAHVAEGQLLRGHLRACLLHGVGWNRESLVTMWSGCGMTWNTYGCSERTCMPIRNIIWQKN